jgi:putative hydrolase
MVRALPATLRTQLRTVGRVQAVMSVCEGYSNYVMHQVGSRHLADFEKLETAFHQRSAQRSPLERVVFRVTGLSMKMRQYELGERFAERVVARGGLSLLNRVWEGPEFMPSMAELQRPADWVARVGGARA